jgi:hypothetical protein
MLFSGLRVIDWIYRHRIPGRPELFVEARKVAFVRLPRAFFNDATLRFEVLQQPVRQRPLPPLLAAGGVRLAADAFVLAARGKGAFES